MALKARDKVSPGYFKLLLGFALFFSACTAVRKYQKNKPFVYNNIINLNADNISQDEKVVIKSRLNTQLDDSSKVRIKDVAFILHYMTIPRPLTHHRLVAQRVTCNYLW